MPPSDYEKRIVAMFDSFCKTVVRNCSRNLKRTKRNADKHSIGEPVSFFWNCSAKLRNLHMNAWCFMQMNCPARFKARLCMKRFALCRRRSGRCCFSDFGAALEMKRSHVGCR